ncbi:hypothetical protein B0H13DRAFT_2542527 [Mycena leptocephala]|nr:hypothetical protein B0H13DRAFT_2542527 [Mycena leptocephala]
MTLVSENHGFGLLVSWFETKPSTSLAGGGNSVAGMDVQSLKSPRLGSQEIGTTGNPFEGLTTLGVLVGKTRWSNPGASIHAGVNFRCDIGRWRHRISDFLAESLSSIAPVFFPITNENRNDRMSVEAALSAILFTVHTSVALQRQMIDNGDSCSNLCITKVEYFQRDVAPLHEFLCFSYEDVATPGVSNFMVIERWGTDFQPPDNSKEKVEQHTLTLSSDNAVPESTTTFSEQALFVSKASARQSLELSGKRTTSIADDRVVISRRRIHYDIEKIEPGKRTLLATMTPPSDSTISVAEILALASFISKHSPVYDLLESSCFYYGRAIFDVRAFLVGESSAAATDRRRIETRSAVHHSCSGCSGIKRNGSQVPHN